MLNVSLHAFAKIQPAPGANLEEEPAAASDHELSMVPIEDLHQSEMQAPDRAIEVLDFLLIWCKLCRMHCNINCAS